MEAPKLDTGRAIALLESIQRARVEHAEAEAEAKRLTNAAGIARARRDSLELHIQDLHAKFSDLTKPPELEEHRESDQPTVANSAERSRKRRKEEPPDALPL